MRHVPEDELHAYLDQALSRSQCIEIETHLARCAPCRDDRDQIAGLRDRTTLLLARVAPRVSVPPPYAQLLARGDERRKTSWRRLAVLAAGLAGAAVAGWGMRAMLDPHTPAGVGLPAAVALAAPADPTAPVTAESVIRSREAAIPSLPESHQAAPTVRLASTTPPVATPAATGRPVGGLALGDGWVASSRAEAEAAGQNLIPEVPGLTVSGIRLRVGAGQERPAVIVAQTLPGGGTVYTVEGPVDAVAELVADQLSSGVFRASEPTRSAPDYLPIGSGYRRAPRVLAVVGALSSDSLNVLAQRVTLR
ncbi:MAG: zf-HC2 domain-containing protein [Gemmatimonadota bacterium]